MSPNQDGRDFSSFDDVVVYNGHVGFKALNASGYGYGSVSVIDYTIGNENFLSR